MSFVFSERFDSGMAVLQNGMSHESQQNCCIFSLYVLKFGPDSPTQSLIEQFSIDTKVFKCVYQIKCISLSIIRLVPYLWEKVFSNTWDCNQVQLEN